jgi:hypothetical protein
VTLRWGLFGFCGLLYVIVGEYFVDFLWFLFARLSVFVERDLR